MLSSPAKITECCINYAYHTVYVSLHQCNSGLQYVQKDIKERKELLYYVLFL